jgi:tetratricopeptide (TPR) repeat protein
MNKKRKSSILFFTAVFFFVSSLSASPKPPPSPRQNSDTSQAQSRNQVDPFYLKLFEDGKYFYRNADYPEAIENFEIAFFGLLDSPAKLLECCIYLAVCHNLVKNTEKAKYYRDEIARLNLQGHLKTNDLPKELADTYLELDSYFARLDARSSKTASSSALAASLPPLSRTSPQDTKLAVEQLKQAISGDPRNFEAYFRLSALYVAQNKLKDGRKTLEELIKVAPQNGTAYFEIGKIYLRDKKSKNGLASFEKAALLLPGDIEIHYELAKLYFDSQKYGEARQEFGRVQKIKEDYKDTAKYLALLESADKKK